MVHAAEFTREQRSRFLWFMLLSLQENRGNLCTHTNGLTKRLLYSNIPANRLTYPVYKLVAGKPTDRLLRLYSQGKGVYCQPHNLMVVNLNLAVNNAEQTRCYYK